MNTHYFQASLLAGAVLFSQASVAASEHWSYQGETGPSSWGELSKEYIMCSIGRQQSPIDITDSSSEDQPEISFFYSSGGYEMINNGHTLQVNYEPGSFLMLGDHPYMLKQFHFHSPSENTIAGQQYPLEAHFVHTDEVGNIAVVAVMYENGQPNSGIQKVWQNLPTLDQSSEYATSIDASELLPTSIDSYQFTGSLTTPPCSENVSWIVLKESKTADKAMINAFGKVVHLPNNRPVQPLNDRTVSQ